MRCKHWVNESILLHCAKRADQQAGDLEDVLSRLRLNRAGFVYFVQEAELKRIKIGFTASHPAKRLKTLANASSQRLVFLGFQVGDEVLEKKLHRKFVSLHCRNEWFHAGADLLAYIDRLSYGSEFEKALQKFTLAPGQKRPQKNDSESSGRTTVIHLSTESDNTDVTV